MKKLIIFLLISISVFSQNSSRLDSLSVSKIKLTTTPTTSTSNDLLTWNATSKEVEKHSLASLQPALTDVNFGNFMDVGMATKLTPSGSDFLLGRDYLTNEAVEIPFSTVAGSQDLQATIDNGQIYSTNDDRSYGMIGGIDESYTGGVTRFYETDSLGNTGLLSINKSEILLLNDTSGIGSAISINDGNIEIAKSDYSVPADNRLLFKTPTATTNTYVPSKSIAGNYVVNTTAEATYTVSTLPSGVLNDMAIVTDATSPTYLGTLTGGGSVVCPVWHNGTTWVAH